MVALMMAAGLELPIFGETLLVLHEAQRMASLPPW
jgi:hypothetical protein